MTEPPQNLGDMEMMYDSDGEPSVFNELPRVSKGTMSDVKDVLVDCEDGEVLKYYMPKFLERFCETEDNEDLDQLILILRNIILLPPAPEAAFSDTQRERTKCLLAKLLLTRWNRKHDVNDVEESVLVFRQLHEANPSDKEVEEQLSDARVAQSSQRKLDAGEGLSDGLANNQIHPQSFDLLIDPPSFDSSKDKHRLFKFCGTKRERRNTENAMEPVKKPRLFKHVVQATDDGDVLDQHPEVSDTSRVPEHVELLDSDEQSTINHLPRISEKTVSNLIPLLACLRDCEVLKYYIDRFARNQDEEDLNQLISLLRDITQLLPSARKISMFSDVLLRDLENSLVTFLKIRWDRTHDASDAQESIRLSHRLLQVDAHPPEGYALDAQGVEERIDHGERTPKMSPTRIVPVALENNAGSLDLDTPATRIRLFCETWGPWWDSKFFPEPAEKSRLSEHFVQMLDEDILEQLPKVSDVGLDQKLSILLKFLIKQFNQENLADIDVILHECHDIFALAHYMGIFEEHFQSRWKIVDLERQITALRGILSITPDQDLTRKLQRDIVMVLFHPVVLKEIQGGTWKDLKLIIDFARKVLRQDPLDDSVRKALYNALVSHDFLESLFRRSAKIQNMELGLVYARQYIDCLEESLLCVPDDTAKQTMVLLQISKIMAMQAASSLDVSFYPSIHHDLIGRAQATFEKVWEKKHLILSERMPNPSVTADMMTTAIGLYHITSGSEYLHRVDELKSISGWDDFGIQILNEFFKTLVLPRLKENILRRRANVDISPADFLSAVRLAEERFLRRHKEGFGEIDYDMLNSILDQYNELYLVTESADIAEKLGKYAHFAILNPPPQDNPFWDRIWGSSMRALISHFLSDPIRNVNSLREATQAIFSTMLNAGSVRQEVAPKTPIQSLSLLCFLGRAYCALFEITWHIPTIDFAILCLRLTVKVCSKLETEAPEVLESPSVQERVDLAYAIFLREDYLKSVAEFVDISDEIYAHALEAAGVLRGSMDRILQTCRQDPPVHSEKPGPELQIAVTKFMSEGGFRSDVEPEWSRLLNTASEVLEAYKNSHPHGRASGLGTQLRLIICRAHFSGEYTDLQIRKTLINAFKEAVYILQKLFVDRGHTFRSQRGLIDNRIPFFRELLAIPFQTAYYAICWAEVQSAIELLDYGRSIIWSRMRRLRITDLQLNGISDDLRSQFIQTCAGIERAITLEPVPEPEGLFKSPGNVDSKVEGVDHPSHVHLQRERLEEKLSSIVKMIREFPGYEDFLQMVPFKSLRHAAREGPVIIVTMASREMMLKTYRSKPLLGHAVIVLESRDPVVVTLDAEDFEDRVNKVNKQLNRIRRMPGSESSNSELMKVLEEIGELFVKDVVAALISLGIKDQSRIWWCLTSVFSTFPVHAAMWRYEAEDRKYRLMCISDLYISSYTPSLAALIQARLPPPLPKVERSSRTSMLVIKQQDVQLATADREVENIVLAASKAGHSFGDSFKLYSGDENERTDILKDLPDYDWIHLTCHGVLDATDPFSSHFQISGGIDGVAKITIMDILRSRVPNAEFAFLSACHTAELPEHFSREESLHLAAAMQFCGYRSVVGTLWPMNDEDGPRVAKAFYEYMFTEPKEGEEVGYLRSARALNKVTQRMRRHPDYKNCPERWVNFVHIGA